MRRRFTSGERGQDLVEYAITLPIFLLLIFAIFDLGRGVYFYSAMHNATREGARYGSVHPDEADLATTICDRVEARAIGVTLTCDPATDITLDYGNGLVTVDIYFSFPLVTPILGDLLGINPIEMSTASTMEMEWIP